jgi:hypothetical protein
MSEVNKIANYNQMMSWLTRPATPKTQFASAETDALKEEFNEKLGPGVIKTLDELPPVQNPFKDFEDRQQAAQGGVIGEGGMFRGQDMGTREGFNYIIKQVNEKRIKASQAAGSGIDISSLTPKQKKLYNEGKLFYTRVKEFGDSKKYKNVFGTKNYLNFITGKINIKDLPDDLSNLPQEVNNRGQLAQLIKKKFISDYLSTLPKGSKILLDNTARIINEKLIEATNGRIRLPDKKQLQLVLNDKKLNINNIKAPESVKEAKNLMIADEYPEKKELPKFKKVADNLNEQYGLKDKGINFKANTSAKTGRVFLELHFSSPAIRDQFNKVPRLTSAPTKEGIEKLTSELDNVINTDFFKNYDSKVGQASGMTLEKALQKVQYNQPELFEYLLNKEGPVSEKEVMDKIGYNKGTLRKAVGNLHENMYRALDVNQPGSGRFLSDQYNSDQIKNVLTKVKNNFEVDYYRRTFEKLLIDAYGSNTKKYKPLINKLEKFRDLQKELKKAGVGEEFIAQLDHVIPYNFLQLIRKGENPENLIRVKAYPGLLNNNRFKGTLDKKLGQATKIFEETGDRKLLDTMNELRSFLPEDMGQVSSGGKRISDYGAKPFNLKTMYSEQQKKFGEVYKRTQEFLENPKVIDLLKDAGISFKALSQLKKLNVPGFLNTFNQLKKARPELFVGVENDFSEIENQYAALDTGTMSDVSPIKKKQEPEGIPAEAIAAGTVGATKYGPQILKALKNVGKVGLTTAGSVPLSAYLAGKELTSEDPNYSIAGAELLLPELGKKVAGSGTGIMSKAGRFLTNPIGRLARGFTPAGIILQGGELVNQAIKEQKRIDNMKENDPEAYQQFIAEQEDMLRESAAYGGRMGFADGPEDPDKRKFMKIMGGLASLPIVGRLFDTAQVVEKAAPVVAETIKGVPPYFFRLVEKIKFMGDDITEKAATQDRQVVKSYKDYEMTEDLATGEIVIRKRNEGVFYDQDGIISDEYMTYKPGIADETTKTRPIDEYDEYTVRPDNDGKLTDSEDGLDSIDEILEEAGDTDSMTLKK